MNIKSLFLFLLAVTAISNGAVAQDSFTVQIQPVTINGAPSVHSYAWGKTTDGKWVVVGGRLDGLHQRQPFASFLENDNNKSIYVIDPVGNQTWSTSISTLQTSVFEQLQSTNQEFFQRGNTLYVIGGYGYSATQGDHVTYDKLTAIDVDGVANAVINNNSITSFFRQISHPDLAVTGGQLGLLDDTFYLCGGQYFEGRYNPQGPNNGPGFVQNYTDEIRTFEIIDDGTTMSIANYTAQNDINNLHRRDYNMAPQIFPDGSEGFTMFSGVFQYAANIPWLNTVDVSATGYNVNNNFNQYLSQYHSAKIPVYDASNNEMHTLFFGGLSQFKLDASGNLIQDDNVPFVKTISKVTRFSDGSMTESALNIEMPTFLGSGSEFIPVHDPAIYGNDEIMDLNNLPDGSTLVGYIYGGIESSQENIFFINNGTQSSASDLAFEVFIVKNTLGIGETVLEPENIYNLKVYPNPSQGIFEVEVFIPNTEESALEVYDLLGKKVSSKILEATVGVQKVGLDLTQLASGEYFLIFKNSGSMVEEKIIKL